MIILIRIIPDIPKSDQRSVRQHAHEKKAFIGICNIQSPHIAAIQHLINSGNKSVKPLFCFCVRVALHADIVENQGHQVIAADPGLAGQDLADPLSAQPFLAQKFLQIRGGGFSQIS